VILAALQGVPADLYEAARVDGANWRASFRYVTLPVTIQRIVHGIAHLAEQARRA